MMPSAFIQLRDMPLTPTGQVDRRALPMPKHRVSGDHYEPPRTPTEDLLSAIWAEVLKVDRISRQDNFFELGGHSLLAMQIVSRIQMRFQVTLPMRAVFEAPTIAELSATIQEMRQGPSSSTWPPLQTVDRTPPLPLSFAQQRLWFLEQLEGSSPTYNLSEATRLSGVLHVEALEQALKN